MIAANYINRSVITVFATTLTVILLIAVGERFTHFLEKAALGQIPSTTVLTVVALRLPEILQMVVPFALYFSLLLFIFLFIFAVMGMQFFSSQLYVTRTLRYVCGIFFCSC